MKKQKHTKHKHLNIHQKQEILHRLLSGEKIIDIAQEFHVHPITVHRVKHKIGKSNQKLHDQHSTDTINQLEQKVEKLEKENTLLKQKLFNDMVTRDPDFLLKI